MSADHLIRGQRVAAEKLRLARELRRRMTPEEQALWQYLRGNRLHGLHFRRQQVIDGFVVDFYCDAARLVVELDGGVHEHRVEYDAERDEALSRHGLRVLRIPNADVSRDLAAVLARILVAADEDGPAGQGSRDSGLVPGEPA